MYLFTTALPRLYIEWNGAATPMDSYGDSKRLWITTAISLTAAEVPGPSLPASRAAPSWRPPHPGTHGATARPIGLVCTYLSSGRGGGRGRGGASWERGVDAVFS
jgi:hypothetical protein